jgi:uncharacterized membrane protein YfcA
VIAAVVLGLAIGLALGALGGGGSILAVPVLVHLAGQSVTAATATSLVAVGAAAAMGSVGHARAGRVRWDAAATFVAVGVLGSWVGAQVNHRVDGDVLLLAFSGLVLVAAHRMLTACPSCTREGEEEVMEAAADPLEALAPAAHGPAEGGGASMATRGSLGPTTAAPAAPATPDGPGATPAASTSTLRSLLDDPRHAARVVGAGLLVGFLTGAFGVGGGFVVVPAMTLVLGLSMPVAIGTSLVVVAGNAAVALAIRGLGAVEWDVAVPFTATMLVGSLVGGLVAHRLPAKRSLHAFAVLLVGVAVANGIAAAVALAG